MTKTVLHQLKGLVEEKLFADDGAWNLAKRQEDLKLEPIPRGVAVKKLKILEDSTKLAQSNEGNCSEFIFNGANIGKGQSAFKTEQSASYSMFRL